MEYKTSRICLFCMFHFNESICPIHVSMYVFDIEPNQWCKCTQSSLYIRLFWYEKSPHFFICKGIFGRDCYVFELLLLLKLASVYFIEEIDYNCK